MQLQKASRVCFIPSRDGVNGSGWWMGERAGRRRQQTRPFHAGFDRRWLRTKQHGQPAQPSHPPPRTAAVLRRRCAWSRVAAQQVGCNHGPEGGDHSSTHRSRGSAVGGGSRAQTWRHNAAPEGRVLTGGPVHRGLLDWRSLRSMTGPAVRWRVDGSLGRGTVWWRLLHRGIACRRRRESRVYRDRM